MNPEAPKIGPKDNRPGVMLNYVRDPKTGALNGIRCAPLTPGMIIERMGKHYQVDAKGTQRRLKEAFNGDQEKG